MEKVLIDTFVVPEDSKAAFLEGARQAQSFLRTLPGFVEGFLYEKQDGESRNNFLTTAVWKMRKLSKTPKRPWLPSFKDEVSTHRKD